MDACLARIAELEQRIEETEETLNAIRTGEVDAVVIVRGPDDPQVYTLEDADGAYRALVEQMHEGAVTMSGDGTLLYCNRRFAEMVELPQERVAGSNVGRFLPEADRETLAMLMAGTAQGARAELTLSSALGAEIPIYLSLIDLANEGEHIICGVVTDLSEQKRRERELHGLSGRLAEESRERDRIEAQLRQAQKMEVIGQLTGGIAHDFNNLLTVIIGNLQQAQSRGEEDAALTRQMGAALHAAERGARLTRQLLAFSRQQELRPEIVCVRDFLADAEALIRSAIGADILIDCAPAPLSYCRVDPSQLEATLFNLCINARDAMPDGGRLKIKAEETELREPAVGSGIGPGLYICISVIDTGMGMAQDVLARVFEPFFTTKDVGKGSGLGLSQVYGFAQQSGGTVTITSERGRGTEVCLYLPLTEPPRADPDDISPAVAMRDCSPVAVLVVEDDPAVRQVSGDMIESMGHTVVSVENAEEALRVLDERPDIGLLFTDIVMPGGVNGVDLACEAQRRRNIAVLLTSGYTAMPHSLTRSSSDFRILWKPYRNEDLVRAVSEVLSRRQPAEHAAAQSRKRRILAVEDDSLISAILAGMLDTLGCELVGPASTLAEATEKARQETFDAALLDIRLGGELVYPLADTLAARNIPFAFMSGFGEGRPDAYRNRPTLPKPYDEAALRKVLAALFPDD